MMNLRYASQSGLIETDARIRQAIATVSESFLREVVHTLAYPRHFHAEPEANRRAANWIFTQLQSFGYQPFYQGAYQNVVAFSRPASDTAQAGMILIGAHYDSVPGSPGADDNGSAVAALLACAQVIARHPGTAPVCFVAFNREEEGFVGSEDFVDHYVRPMRLPLRMAHVLEMVGYCRHEPDSQRQPEHLPVAIPTVGDFLGIIGRQISNPAVAQVAQQAHSYLPDLPVVGLQVELGIEQIVAHVHLLRSDHVCFWQHELPALMWTDTANFRNPNYHRPTDTPETVDYQFLRRVTQLLTLQALLA